MKLAIFVAIACVYLSCVNADKVEKTWGNLKYPATELGRKRIVREPMLVNTTYTFTYTAVSKVGQF